MLQASIQGTTVGTDLEPAPSLTALPDLFFTFLEWHIPVAIVKGTKKKKRFHVDKCIAFNDINVCKTSSLSADLSHVCNFEAFVSNIM